MTATLFLTVLHSSTSGSFSCRYQGERKSSQRFQQQYQGIQLPDEEECQVPQVEASAKSKDVSVEIEQARAIPGTAVVRFADYNTYEEDVYLISFDYESVSDEFNGSAPGSQWQWLRK